MASTYVNDLRIEEQATGENSGTWGTKVNSAFSQIAEAFSYGTKQLAADSNETFTMPDGTSDGTRSLYLKITSAGSLTATRTVTLGPNTVSKLWIIENATTGSQSITIAQGSGGTVTIPTGAVKMVYSDGAGSGAAVVDALVDLHLSGSTNLASLNVDGTVTADGLDVSSATGTSTITPTELTISTTSSGSNFATGSSNEWGVLGFYKSDTSGGGAGKVATIGASMVNAIGGYGSLHFKLENTSNSYALEEWLTLQNSASAASRQVNVLADGGLYVENNVGIGTASPATALHVVDTTGDVLTLESDSLSASPNIIFKNTDGEKARINSVDAGELYFGTGASGTEAMRIDSSQNVGIGTDSPDTLLHLSKSGNSYPSLRFERNDTTVSSGNIVGRIEFEHQDATNAGVAARMLAEAEDGSGSVGVAFETGTPTSITERFRIDASGNVKIANPNKNVSDAEEGILFSGALPGLAYFTRDDNLATSHARLNSYGGVIRVVANGNAGGQIGSGASGALSFYNGAGTSEHLRIDASGNLLVGVTTNTTTTSAEGLVYNNGGSLLVTRDQAPAAYLTRTTSDGDIAVFRQGSAPVGSIGVNASTLLQVSSASSGGLFLADNGTNVAGFANSENAFRPASDNTIDLGKTDRRFKDLYLSGGVYLGGTGASNQLDDYEEGTWTPTYSPQSSAFTSITYDAAVYGKYVKVGAVVHIQGIIRTDAISGGSGQVYIGGMPFTSDNYGVISIGYTNDFAGDHPGGLYTAASSTDIIIRYRTSANSGLDNLLDVTDLNTGANSNYIIFSGTYMTTQ